MRTVPTLLVILCLVLPTKLAAQPSEERPNVLLFLVDDMGLMDTSVPFLTDAEGNPKRYPLNNFYRTPNMQRLARMGTRYSQFYANSVCSPTRTSIMNGQFSARHYTTQFISPERKNTGTFGPLDWKWEGFEDNDLTLPRLLSSAGYQTIHSGKAHFGPVGKPAENPLNIGFDVNIAGCSYGQPGSYLGMKNYGNGIKNRQKRAVPGLEKYHGTQTHLTEACTIEMKAALSESVEMKKPFFAYMSHYAVHSPFEADERFVQNYGDASPKLAAFASLIEGMDKSLGDLLDHLETLGVAENTLVIFLGDNGTDAPIGDPHAISCAAPLRGKKGTHYEGGMRVPCIAAWAKPDANNPFQSRNAIQPDRIVTRGFGQLCDVFATILDVTSTKDAAHGHVTDGMSLLQSFEGQLLPADREFLMHFPHAHRSSYFSAFRKGSHKLVYHYPVKSNEASKAESKVKGKKSFPRVELFDLATDPTEQTNLATNQPARCRELLEAMINALEDSKAQFPMQDGEVLKPSMESL